MSDMPRADIGFVGETFETNNYGPLRVLRRSRMGKHSTALYEVEFINTGYRKEDYKSNIRNGHMRDDSVARITPNPVTGGYLGNASCTDGEGGQKSAYSRWSAML